MENILKQVVQSLEESQLKKTFESVVIDTMKGDNQFIRILGSQIDIHGTNENHIRLDGETQVRGQLRFLGSPDQLKFGALHQMSGQTLSFVPSTGISPLPVLQPHNPIQPIVQLINGL